MTFIRQSVSLVLLVAALVALSAHAGTPATSIDLSSPERTLSSYLGSLVRGDLSGVEACVELGDQKYSLPGPIPISKYKVVKKVVYGTREVNEWNSKGIVPPALVGDVQLDVEEITNNIPAMYSYNFRRFGSDWKIVSYSRWGAD